MSAAAESSRGIQLRLVACYIAVFLAPGVGLPFWPTWLASRHLSDFEIGVLLAVGPWVKVIGNPLFSHAADPDSRHRRRPGLPYDLSGHAKLLADSGGGHLRHHVHHQHGAADRRRDAAVLRGARPA